MSLTQTTGATATVLLLPVHACGGVCACVYLCMTEFMVPSVRRCRLDVWQLLTWPSVQPFKFNFWSLAVKATSDSDLMDVSLSPQWSVRGTKWHFLSFFPLFSKEVFPKKIQANNSHGRRINCNKQSQIKETRLMRLNSVYRCVAFTVNPDMFIYCILNIQSLNARFPNPPFMPKSLRRD